MPKIHQFAIYSETALAAYALGLLPGADNSAAYTADKVKMTASQATEFNATYDVLQQSTPTINGFSAVLLQNRTTGEKVLAIAGTDPSSPADLITDLVNVGLYGTVLGMPQYASLESFYAQLVSTGKLGASEQVTVTGHSLGGFLAQAFTARHTNVVSAAYTYNAPGFGSTELMLGFLGVTDAAGAAAKITNVHATDGLSITAGLGVMLGTSQPVRIEGDVSPLNNHSVVRLGDALAIFDTYARLQSNISMDQASSLFVASGTGDRRQEDALDALRTVFIGSASNDSNKTATDDRDAFYNNLYQLQNNAGFKTLSGQVQLVQVNPGFAASAHATTDAALAYRYALLELLPFAVVANTDAQNQTLYGSYTQRLSLYDETTGQGQLTQSWLTDRTAFLSTIAYRNQYDLSGALTPNPSLGIKAGHYLDVASNTDITVGLNISSTREFNFGGDAADSFVGRSAEDQLYGGAGNDTLNGLGGNDYLEGNAGDDSLIGGDGNDTLVGGTGSDTYQFTGSFGHDTITDSDGLGQIIIDSGAALSGGKKVLDNVWENDDQTISYTLAGTDLIIKRGSSVSSTMAGTILVKNWQAGQLGITLDNTPAATSASTHTYTGDQRAKLIGIETQLSVTADKPNFNSYAWNEISFAADGHMNNGVAEVNFADVLYGSAQADKISGLGGNDALSGGAGDDQIDGGTGDDLIGGGAGSDTITGGDGNDYINSSADLNVNGR